MGSSVVTVENRSPCRRHTVVPATTNRRRGSDAASSAADRRSAMPAAISMGYVADAARTVSRTGAGAAAGVMEADGRIAGNSVDLHADFLIIGSGIAALRAAAALS